MNLNELSKIELRALYLCAEIGYQMPNPDLERDPFLESAAERAIKKIQAAYQTRKAA